VSDEHGNYDYLMFADLDHSHSEVGMVEIGEHQVVVVSVLITHIARPVFVLSQYLVS
jgi:hypothetical protein